MPSLCILNLHTYLLKKKERNHTQSIKNQKIAKGTKMMKNEGRKGKGQGRKKHFRRLDRKKRGQEMDKSLSQTVMG